MCVEDVYLSGSGKSIVRQETEEQFVEQEINLNGKWWFPKNSSNQKYSGSLRIRKGNEATLEIECTNLEWPFTKESVESDLGEIIHGETNEQQPVTLLDCVLTDNGFTSQKSYALYLVISVFVGAHFYDKAELRFKSVSVVIANWQTWFHSRSYKKHTDQGLLYYIVKMTEALEIQTTVEPGLSITCFPGGTSNGSTPEKGLRRKTHIRIVALDNNHFDRYQTAVRYLRDFVTFLCLRSSLPIEFEGTVDDGESVERTVTVYYPFGKNANERETRSYVFCRGDIDDEKLNIVLRQWFRLCRAPGKTIGLFFSEYMVETMFEEHVFLNLVISLEAHAGRLSTKGRLHSKLVEIFHRYRFMLSKLINDIQFFSERVVSTRNYWIHSAAKLEKRAFHFREIVWVNRILRLVVVACWISELGVNQEEIELLFNNSKLIQEELDILKNTGIAL